jgi:hypothetical protein
MQIVRAQAPKEAFAQYDYKVLLALLSCIRGFEFKRDTTDEQSQQEFAKIVANCVTQIDEIIAIYESGKHLELLKGASALTVQVIPNVRRIMIEKLVVQRVSREKATQLPPLASSVRKQLDGIQAHSYYRENIFSIEDMYLYRGIFKFYSGDYKGAHENFERSWNKHLALKANARDELRQNKKLGIESEHEAMYGKFPASQLVSPIHSVSNKSLTTDLSDIGLCSLNVQEHSFNVLLTALMNQDWQLALTKSADILHNASQEPGAKSIYLLRALIFQELDDADKYAQEMAGYLKHCPQP